MPYHRKTLPQVVLLCIFAACFAAHSPIVAAQAIPAAAGNMDLMSPEESTEDLNDLSLRHSSLFAATPIPGGVETTPDYIREFIRLEWRSGDPVEVYVIRPRNVARPPVAIYLYGYPVDEGRFRNDEFCKLVTRNGVAAIGFVPAFVGQRYHNVPARQWFVSELHDSIAKTVHDVQMIVNYAATRPDLDGNQVGIFGQGAGATIAGLAATVDPRIQAVDLLDPWGDWPEWMAHSGLIPADERAGFLKPEFLKPLAPLDPVQWLPSLANRPLKLDDALFETGTPLAAKQRMEAVLPATALLKRYSSKAEFEQDAISGGKLIDWLQGRLHSASPSSAPAHAQVTPARVGSSTMPAGSRQEAQDSSQSDADHENWR